MHVFKQIPISSKQILQPLGRKKKKRKEDAKAMVPSGLEPETLWLLAIRSDQLSYETSCWPLQLLGQGFRLPFLFTHLKSAHHSQSAQVIKGVDLRSTAGNSAWVQTPWLTLSRVQASCLTPSTSQVATHLIMDKALDL